MNSQTFGVYIPFVAHFDIDHQVQETYWSRRNDTATTVAVSFPNRQNRVGAAEKKIFAFLLYYI